MRIPVKRKKLLYYLGLFFATLSNTVVGKTYLFQIPYLNPTLKFITLACFCLVFLDERWTLKNLTRTILMVLVSLVVALISDNNMLVIYVFALMLSAKEDFKNICRFLFKTNLALVLLVVGSSLLGILNNEIYIHNNKKAYTLGFAYYSTFPYYVFFLSILGYYVYCKNNKRTNTWLYMIVSICLNFVAYKVSSVRLTFVCSIGFAALIIVYDVFKFISHKKINIFIATIMSPIMFLLSIVLPFVYQKNRLLIALDKAINGRLYFGKMGFARYGIELFGNHIVTDAGGLDANWHNTYFFIDSGYVYLLLGYGIIVTILILIAYTMISRYAIKTQDSKLFLWSILVCIFSFINNPLMDIFLNPLLFAIVPMISKKIKRA